MAHLRCGHSRTVRGVAFALSALLFPWVPALGASPELFAFDNGVGREQRWTPAQQASVLRELGYAGIGYSGVNDLKERVDAFAASGLRIYSVYVGLLLDGGPDDGPAIREALPQLGESKIDVWLTLRGRGAEDATAVQAVRALADAAAAHGVRIVLYPHKGFFVATAEDGVRIVRQVGRSNVGVTLNVAHEIAAGNATRLDEVAQACGDHLFLVSINGADPEGGWERVIRPLDEGAVDVRGFVARLMQRGYRGPIGLQCYAIKGEPVTLLRRSMRTWRGWNFGGAPDSAKR
jgi:sugar phosphate isomerase/epimerase